MDFGLSMFPDIALLLKFRDGFGVLNPSTSSRSRYVMKITEASTYCGARGRAEEGMRIVQGHDAFLSVVGYWTPFHPVSGSVVPLDFWVGSFWAL